MNDIAQNQGMPMRHWRDALMTPWTLVVLLPVAVVLLDRPNAADIVSFAISAFVSTLPYIAFAVLLIAALKAAGAEGILELDIQKIC